MMPESSHNAPRWTEHDLKMIIKCLWLGHLHLVRNEVCGWASSLTWGMWLGSHLTHVWNAVRGWAATELISKMLYVAGQTLTSFLGASPTLPLFPNPNIGKKLTSFANMIFPSKLPIWNYEIFLRIYFSKQGCYLLRKSILLIRKDHSFL